MNFRRLCLSSFALCSLALLVPISGCMAGSTDPNDSEEDAVAEAESAFGEAACGTDWASPDVTLTNTWPQMIPTWQSSSSLPYGDATCTSAFRVLYQHYPPSGYKLKAKFNHDASVAMPFNQVNCEHSYVESVAYDSAGNPIGTSSKAFGVWQSGAGVCALPGSFLNPGTASASASNAKLATAWARIASCFTDPVTHRLFCLYWQDGVSTSTSL